MRSDGLTNGFAWLGVVVGALSVVKVLNVVIDLGLTGVWADILQYYNELTYPLRELVFRIPFSTYFPIWLPDALVLYSVLLIAGLRATVLPLRSAEYYMSESRKDYREISVPRIPQEVARAFLVDADKSVNTGELTSIQTHVNHSTIGFVRIVPRWKLVIHQSIICLTLLPVITLEPVRNLRMPVIEFFRIQEEPNPANYEFKYRNGEGGHFASWFVESERMKLNGAAQIISLPLFVLLFLVGAAYIS